MECAGTFTVQTEIFGEGLSDAGLESLFDEVTDCPCVARKIAGCETLIRAVEEGEVALCAHDFGDAFPLFGRWVDTCWVMCACVQDND